MDYYKILGVPNTATEQEIKQAYRKMAAKHHPDREGGNKEEFQKIEEAYRILSDPQTRQQHDNPQPQGMPDGFHFNFGGGGAGFNPFEEIFRQTFNPRRTRVYTVTVAISLEQIANGSNETIQIQTAVGSKAFNISIPKGVEDGQRVNYENLMPDGVLQITFRIHRHSKFERRGLDLFTTENISVFDLILGTKISVTTILNQTLEITIPPRTNPGSSLRIAGHGLESAHGTGDQYVVISPIIPEVISDEVLQLLQSERNKTQDNQ